MPTYRLKPQLPVWRIAGVVGALLVAPIAVNLALPPLDDASEPVNLGSRAMQWQAPLNWPEGNAVRCEPGDMDVFNSWNCEGATIYTTVQEDVRDVENTLRRAIRATKDEEPDQGELLRDGKLMLLETKQAIAIAEEGTGEREGMALITVVSGDQQRPFAALAMHALRGGQGRLPDIGEIGTNA